MNNITKTQSDFHTLSGFFASKLGELINLPSVKFYNAYLQMNDRDKQTFIEKLEWLNQNIKKVLKIQIFYDVITTLIADSFKLHEYEPAYQWVNWIYRTIRNAEKEIPYIGDKLLKEWMEENLIFDRDMYFERITKDIEENKEQSKYWPIYSKVQATQSKYIHVFLYTNKVSPIANSKQELLREHFYKYFEIEYKNIITKYWRKWIPPVFTEIKT